MIIYGDADTFAHLHTHSKYTTFPKSSHCHTHKPDKAWYTICFGPAQERIPRAFIVVEEYRGVDGVRHRS